ncbi:DUF692 domain-containing protein [Pontixanthobacter sp.]|uniref:MNIO family bufferin maturase n=1 Tax=Pontixanthobacter sp. TaxID=2792078 RepID=UPI003C7A2358
MSSIASFSGFGLGLRRPHYEHFLRGDVPVDFVEVISENFMVDGGSALRTLEDIRATMPVILHGVSMSIGSAHGLDCEYLARLEMLANRIDPLWVSDHVCWTRTSAHNSHDLLPLPYTAEALDVVCDNIDHAQETLGRPMLFENPSSYMVFPEDDMTEWEFISAMSLRSGCYLLLDINNIYVSAHNHGFSADDYIAGLPADRVRQVHLAGHTDGEIKIDTHDQPVCDGVWQLYTKARLLLGDVAVMIERDGDIPAISELLTELGRARTLVDPPAQHAAAVQW